MEHKPVMYNEIINYLDLRAGKVILDCTIGTGGHARKILQKITPGGKLIGIDRDADSLSFAEQNLKEFKGSYILVKDDFRNLDSVLENIKIKRVDGILFDLGVSSFQLDNPKRGFSIRGDGPLDMRMDKDSYISAYDLVNSLSEREISSILRNFGQERWHNRIAHLMVEKRSKTPISTTKELSELIVKSIGYKYRDQKIHPATRTFQAIRIAVNRELEALDIALDKAINVLKKDGRICVIAFHSLEDRISKEKIRKYSKESLVNIITKKPLRPMQEEIEDNFRARSARLRVAERI
ncbi:MAG: 16S rRNA (cytosine(1402)-N(4))-methyltransferase RsmH [Candidatus Omnitrophota bacterium]